MLPYGAELHPWLERLLGQALLGSNPASAFISCMVFGKSVNVPKTQVLHLFNRDENYVMEIEGRGGIGDIHNTVNNKKYVKTVKKCNGNRERIK